MSNKSGRGFNEGDVVVCPATQTISGKSEAVGTVVHVYGNDILVLDSKGYIHRCEAYQIYLYQKDQALSSE